MIDKGDGMKKRAAIIGIIILSLFYFISVCEAKTPTVRIGIVRDGPVNRLHEDLGQLKKEITDLLSNDFDIRFPADFMVHGNWTAEGIRDAVDGLLRNPDVDLIIAMGPNSSYEISQRRNLPKPVIAAIVIDAALQNLPHKDGASGVPNLCYINSFKSFERDLAVFRRITPFWRLAVIIDRLTLELNPNLKNYAEHIGHEFTVEIDLIGVEDSPDQAFDALHPGTDAVYVTPLGRFSNTAFDQLIAGLIQRKLPGFSMMGKEEVEAGLFASMSPKTNFLRLLRRIALNVQRILLGEAPGSIPVGFDNGELMSINMATARAIGIYPDWTILTEAEVIDENVRKIDRKLTLATAVMQALAVNLELSASRKAVQAKAYDVAEAKAALLPRVDIDTQAVLIDEDRAEASFGQQAEKTWTGGVTLTQLLYSENAWANYEIQHHLQISREKSYAARRLDIVYETALAYLNVLRARTFEKIQKDNLSLTRANLERAEIRKKIGVASPAEVYRWESEIATRRKDVIKAQSQTRQAMISLNRLLHQPLEEPFELEEADMNDPLFIVSDPRFFDYVDNPHSFGIFRDFMVEEGLAAAPELVQLDAAIAAQQRAVASARNDFWQPTFSLRGNVTHTFSESGEGVESGFSSPMLPITLPEADDTDWSVALDVSFPLYEGGAKSAVRERRRLELENLMIRREAAVEKIAEKIRYTLYLTNTSYPSIRLSRDAADAADRNLELVTDAYARGVVSVIDLLDAQNASLVANQVASNAVYDFLIDLMSVQRAVGQFDFFMTPDQRNIWFEKLAAFYKDRKQTE